jgi:hypothetical protein
VNLLNPGVLWWLLPLGGAIVALYLLRMRRRDLQVPANFLWPERTDEIRANSLFQKLKFSWLMVLQLLALLLIGAALSRPQTEQSGLAGDLTVIVLDASASMSASEGARSRFDLAVRASEQIIADAQPGDKLAMILAGPLPEVVFPLSSDPALQRMKLRDVEGTDAEADVGEALRLAAALAKSDDSAQIILISDGAFEEPENFSPGGASVQFVKVGDAKENLGIEAIGAVQTGEGKNVYVGVRNYGDASQSASLSIHADGDLINSSRFDVKPGETWGRTFPAPANSEVLEARLTDGGALTADDYGVELTGSAAAKQILVVTPGSPFLERVLSLEPGVVVDKSGSVPDREKRSSLGPGQYDIVIFDGVPEEEVKSLGILSFASIGPSSPVSSSGSVKNPTFLSASDHELLDGVDLSGVYIADALRLQLKGSATAAADSDSGPLIVARDGLQRQVVTSFRPGNSDFPLTVAFPIFIANTIEYLAGAAASNVLEVATGQSLALPADEVEVEAPDGTKTTYTGKDGRTVVRGFSRIGPHKVKYAGLEKTVYASLKDPLESSIKPRSDVSLGGSDTEGTEAAIRLMDIWKPLALLALLILAGEWFMFARRS